MTSGNHYWFLFFVPGFQCEYFVLTFLALMPRPPLCLGPPQPFKMFWCLVPVVRVARFRFVTFAKCVGSRSQIAWRRWLSKCQNKNVQIRFLRTKHSTERRYHWWPGSALGDAGETWTWTLTGVVDMSKKKCIKTSSIAASPTILEVPWIWSTSPAPCS